MQELQRNRHSEVREEGSRRVRIPLEAWCCVAYAFCGRGVARIHRIMSGLHLQLAVQGSLPVAWCFAAYADCHTSSNTWPGVSQPGRTVCTCLAWCFSTCATPNASQKSKANNGTSERSWVPRIPGTFERSLVRGSHATFRQRHSSRTQRR